MRTAFDVLDIYSLHGLNAARNLAVVTSGGYAYNAHISQWTGLQGSKGPRTLSLFYEAALNTRSMPGLVRRFGQNLEDTVPSYNANKLQ